MPFKSRFLTLVFVLLSIPASANVVGSDYINFNPTTDGLGYVTVESGDVHEPGAFNLGLFLDYGVGTLPVFNVDGIDPADHRMTSNIHGAIGITEGWSFGFSLTNLIYETAEGNSLAAAMANTGREAFRLDTKVRLLNEKKARLGLFGGLNFNSISDNPYLGASPGPSIAVGAFYERLTSDSLHWAVNLGYRMRNADDGFVGSPIGPIENQIIYSAGFNYALSSWDSHFIGELFGSSPSNSPVNATNRDLSNLEVLLGLKKRYFENGDIHLGVTRGVYSGLATPDFRIYAGLNWYFAPILDPRITGRESEGPGAFKVDDTDNDNDGIIDKYDECPGTEPGRLVDRRGCPLQDDWGMRDDDFDGVDNSKDQCPNTSPDQYVDEFGCKSSKPVANSTATMDADGDGVLNDYDLCPNTRAGVQVTDRGCEKTRIQKIDLGNLNFLTGTAKLTKKSRKRFMKKIDGLYRIRKKIDRIVIEGHTDNVGKRAYNQNLSERRAKTIRRILIKELKISRSKVVAKGYGEMRPIATNKTKRGRLLNRRVEMNVITKE